MTSGIGPAVARPLVGRASRSLANHAAALAPYAISRYGRLPQWEVCRKSFFSALTSVHLPLRREYRATPGRATYSLSLGGARSFSRFAPTSSSAEITHPRTGKLTFFVKYSGWSWYIIQWCGGLFLRALRRGAAAVLAPRKTTEEIIAGARHGWHWTKRGFKLFGANFRVSMLLARKKLQGHQLSRREHKLLVRTTNDLLKLIPFSVFIAVPFAEFLLPVILFFFPGMLPSTFIEKELTQPSLQRKLRAKRELVEFFQEIVNERTRQVIEESANPKSRDRAKSLVEFQQKLMAKAHEEAQAAQETETALVPGSAPDADPVNPFLSLRETLKYAKLFREEFKLEKLPTKALLVVCNMLGLRPYGIRANVILQLQYHILRLQKEDREILWEGVDSLTHEELVDACRDRAMRFFGVSDDDMREQMRRWLELSSHKDIPPLLLLWSRSITMTHAPLVARACAPDHIHGSPPTEPQLSTEIRSTVPLPEEAGAPAPPGPTAGFLREQLALPAAAAPELEELPLTEDPAARRASPPGSLGTPALEPPTLEELLPVAFAADAATSGGAAAEEAAAKADAEIRAKELDLADQRLAELQSAAAELRVERRTQKKAAETRAAPAAKTAADDGDARDASPAVSSVESAAEQRSVMTQRLAQLDRELAILRDAMEKQDDTTSEVLRELSTMLEEYQGQAQAEGEAKTAASTDGRILHAAMDRLAGVLQRFEAALRQVADIMESARGLNLKTDPPEPAASTPAAPRAQSVPAAQPTAEAEVQVEATGAAREAALDAATCPATPELEGAATAFEPECASAGTEKTTMPARAASPSPQAPEAASLKG